MKILDTHTPLHSKPCSIGNKPCKYLGGQYEFLPQTHVTKVLPKH